MKLLMLTFTLILTSSAFAGHDLAKCNMDRPKAPCIMKDEDAAIYGLVMMMVNKEGIELLKEVDEELSSAEDAISFGATLLKMSPDQTSQMVDFLIRFQCKPEPRTCQEYQWKVLMTIEGEDDEGTFKNELTKIE